MLLVIIVIYIIVLVIILISYVYDDICCINVIRNVNNVPKDNTK